MWSMQEMSDEILNSSLLHMAISNSFLLKLCPFTVHNMLMT